MINTLVGFDAITDSSGDPLSLGGSGGGIVGINTGWTEINRQTASSVATIEVVFDATLYDELEWSIYGALPENDSETPWMRVSTDGGSTFLSTSVYDWGNVRVSVAGTNTGDGGDDASEIELSHAVQSFTSSQPGNWSIKAYNLASSAFVSSFTWTTVWVSSTSDDQLNGFGGGQYNTNTVVDGLQFRYATGDIVTGTFVLRGRLKTNATIAGFNPDWEVITEDESPTPAATHDFFWTDDIYDEIEITINGIRAGTDIRNLEFRLSSDGSTFHSGASDYKYATVNHADGGGNAFSNASSGATEAICAISLGTGTDEFCNTKLHFTGISNSSRKMQGSWEGSGIINDASLQRFAGALIDMNTDDRIQGIQFLGESAATMTWDKLVIRGRRKNPQTGSVDIDSTVQTTDDTETTLVSIPVASNQVIVVHGFGMGYDDSTGDTLIFSFTAGAQNEAGTTTSKSSTIDILDSDTTGFDVAWDADDTGDVGRLRVTGAVATTVDWKVRYQITRIN